MSDVPLREYIERRIDDQDRRLTQALDEAEKRTQLALAEARRAVDKAEKALGQRLDLLNEFRQMTQDRESIFATKSALDGLKEIVDKMTGRDQGVAAMATAVGSAAFAVIAIVITFVG